MTRAGQKTTRAALLALALVSGTGQGAHANDRLWANCRTCHAVTAPDGTQLARGGRSGPNLYGLADRPMGRDAGYALYSQSLGDLGAAGRRWTEGDFIAYLAGPDAFLKAATGDASVQSDMHVAMRQGGAELWAYLQSLSR